MPPNPKGNGLQTCIAYQFLDPVLKNIIKQTANFSVVENRTFICFVEAVVQLCYISSLFASKSTRLNICCCSVDNLHAYYNINQQVNICSE